MPLLKSWRTLSLIENVWVEGLPGLRPATVHNSFPESAQATDMRLSPAQCSFLNTTKQIGNGDLTLSIRAGWMNFTPRCRNLISWQWGLATTPERKYVACGLAAITNMDKSASPAFVRKSAVIEKGGLQNTFSPFQLCFNASASASQYRSHTALSASAAASTVKSNSLSNSLNNWNGVRQSSLPSLLTPCRMYRKHSSRIVIACS